MVSQPIERTKDILGYTLKERIGSGGFGEVWSAIAPGGLLKALKIVYGYHDEKRAQAELKALDRVKEVRHPFLLSLERIEVHDGQLIVVSELADKSLADLFNEYASRGEQGIPRDELLKYIRSAADALDYLSEEHGLQHLDIKPENLLIVSGHVKVADFGLIKDLHEASQSLMSGMTPAYAAPELFDGRPGKFSDQYSLAIVYQEMLTAVRPFPGTTPAQLAAQHMHGKPNLRPLPQGDQAVIARALSKDPNVRFESCRAMAEELSNRKRSVKKAIRRIQEANRRTADTESKTVNFDDRDATALISSQGLPFQASEIKSLDPPECDPDAATLQPVLIIGVGATGNGVLKQIKQQMVARHNAMDEIPSVRMLCIDSDRNEITKLCMASNETAFSTEETMSASLCKPEYYRERANSKLHWLSRRWIYNIPRTLQTEGLRPLGRLAFADHFESICDSLEKSLKQIVQPESIAKTAEALEIDPGTTQPKIFIVSSISGGVGSGMVLDIAYTVKLLMAEIGLRTDTVTGVLLHSTYQRLRDPGLAAANAFAFLTELRHFVEHGYPGDSSLGLPEFEDEPPFDHTYFNELGNDLSQTEFDERLGSIAEYLYLSATSKCASFFDKCRELEKDAEHFALRTFGLSVSGPGNPTMGNDSVNQVARALVQRWINGNPETTFDPQLFARSEISRLELSSEEAINSVTGQAKGIFEGDFSSISAGARDIVLRGTSDRLKHLSAYLDGALGCPPSRRDSSHVDPEVCLQMEEIVNGEAVAIGDDLSSSVIDLLCKSQLELSRAKTTVNSIVAALDSAGENVSHLTTICEHQIESSLAQLKEISVEKARTKKEEKEKFESLLASYCNLRFEEFVLRYTKHFYRVVRNGLGAAEGLVAKYGNSLSTLMHEFEINSIIGDLPEDDASINIDKILAESIETQLNDHVGLTEVLIYESVIKELGSYVEMLNDSTCLQHRMPGEIRMAAQKVLADAYKKISLEKLVEEHNVRPEQLVKWLNEKVNLARPVIDDCGGASRIMLGLPALSCKSALPELFQRQFNLNVKAINGTRGSFVVCFEGENVSLANVAYRLLQSRPDAIELVKRIHARNDVEWSTLNDLL
jgi:serine/threonine protein kinase